MLSSGESPHTGGAEVPSAGTRDDHLAQERPALGVHNPHTEALVADAQTAIACLRQAFEEGLIDSGDALGVAAKLHRLAEQVRALHYTAVGLGDESGMWAIAGYLSTESWLRHTHLLSTPHARDCARTARWLPHQPAVAQALADGDITGAHVQAIRRVATSSTKRAAAFGDVAADFVEVARHTDTDTLGRALRSWADAVDEKTTNRSAARDHEQRRVFLTPVGDGWDLTGWLPATDGAELAGILTERMEHARRETPDISMTTPQRRADALLELLRSAAATDMTPAQRDRAKVHVLIPLSRLTDCTNCRGFAQSGSRLSSLLNGAQGPDLQAAQWRTGNGIGRGTLSIAECDRPPGWCEAHHITHWADGGVSAPSNMALLCSRHHHELHQGRWHIHIDNTGQVHVTRQFVRDLGPPNNANY